MEEIKKEPITVLFILLNILIFVIVDFTGGSENTVHMIACGAAYPPLILEEGETYRLFTCMFLHFGIYHIAIICWFCLYLASAWSRCWEK